MISKKEQIQNFIENLKKNIESGDIYGGVKSSYGSIFMTGGYPLFDIDENYKNGVKIGYYVSYERDKNNFVATFEVSEVQYKEAPFTPNGVFSKLGSREVVEAIKKEDSVDQILKMIEDCKIRDIKKVVKQQTLF